MLPFQHFGSSIEIGYDDAVYTTMCFGMLSCTEFVQHRRCGQDLLLLSQLCVELVCSCYSTTETAEG